MVLVAVRLIVLKIKTNFGRIYYSNIFLSENKNFSEKTCRITTKKSDPFTRKEIPFQRLQNHGKKKKNVNFD